MACGDAKPQGCNWYTAIALPLALKTTSFDKLNFCPKKIESFILNESNDIFEDTFVDALSANEAKTQFGELLLKAQRAPVQINKNGKPVAVVISADDYASIEALKLRLLQASAIKAKADIEADNTVDGEPFFDDLESGQYD